MNELLTIFGAMYSAFQFFLLAFFTLSQVVSQVASHYSHQPLPPSTYVEFAVAATDCVAKDVTDPAACNMRADTVGGGPGSGREQSLL